MTLVYVVNPIQIHTACLARPTTPRSFSALDFLTLWSVPSHRWNFKLRM